jgi:replicative DNA helicase
MLVQKKIPPNVNEEFFVGDERELFIAIRDQWDKNGKIDLALLKRDHFATITASMETFGPSSSDHVIEILKDHYRKRAFAKAVLSVKLSGDVATIEALTLLQSEISSILTKNKSGYDHKSEINTTIDALEKIHKGNSEIAGFSTGIDELDIVTNGIEKGKVYVIGALKKTGKSRFGVYLSCMLKHFGAGIFWNSLEMSPFELNVLAISHYSKLDSSVISKKMSKDLYHRFAVGIDATRRLNWSIYKEHTVSELKSQIIAERDKKQIDVVFIDFIQRMRSDKYKSDRVREVESISQDLADMARDLKVAVIEFSQLSGSAEKLEKDQIPDMSHLKESQSIAENADSIWVLHNMDRHGVVFSGNQYVPRPFKLKIEQRYSLSGAVIDLAADLRTCDFYYNPHKSENENG